MTTSPLIIKNLFAHYNNTCILNDISFNFPANCITAIIGPSGCGKSTLLKCLNHSILNDGGTIHGELLLDNNSFDNFSQEMIRTRISLVSQHPVVFPFSIYKNLTYPMQYHLVPKKEWPHKINTSLTQAGLFDEVCNNLKKSATHLSGGQQQRLCLARSLIMNPQVLLLDEPCSALDIKNTRTIESTLLSLKSTYTIVIVTHHLAQAKRIADYVVYMEHGKIVEWGTNEQIFSNPSNQKTKDYISYMSSD
ncbi:MAG: phosphate ABC transporter ATP-binding protein [Cellulosilyticaceae bacterium]